MGAFARTSNPPFFIVLFMHRSWTSILRMGMRILGYFRQCNQNAVPFYARNWRRLSVIAPDHKPSTPPWDAHYIPALRAMQSRSHHRCLNAWRWHEYGTRTLSPPWLLSIWRSWATGNIDFTYKGLHRSRSKASPSLSPLPCAQSECRLFPSSAFLTQSLDGPGRGHWTNTTARPSPSPTTGCDALKPLMPSHRGHSISAISVSDA
jgi:hypothetical protein